MVGEGVVAEEVGEEAVADATVEGAKAEVGAALYE